VSGEGAYSKGGAYWKEGAKSNYNGMFTCTTTTVTITTTTNTLMQKYSSFLVFTEFVGKSLYHWLSCSIRMLLDEIHRRFGEK